MLVLRTIAAAAGWLACVAGAAHGQPLAGPALVAMILLLHAWGLADPLRQLRPVLVVGVVGTLLESAAIAAGAYLPHEAMRGTPFAPLWITALWLNAAVFVQGVFSSPGTSHPEVGRGVRFGSRTACFIAAVAGAVVAPASYSGASWLHAIAVGWSTPVAVVAAAIYGAVITPAVLWLLSGLHSPVIDNPAPTSQESTHG